MNATESESETLKNTVTSSEAWLNIGVILSIVVCKYIFLYSGHLK